MREEHLAELEADIAATETRLAGLKKLRGVALAMLGKAPPKKGKKGGRAAPEPAAPSANGHAAGARQPFDLMTKRREVARFLSTRGATSGRDLITQAGVGPTKLNEVMECDWFAKSSQGYHLTTTGRKEAIG